MKKRSRKLKLKKRVRAKVFGTKKRPRLNVFRSNKYIYGQLIDDEKGETLLSLSEVHLKRLPKKMKKNEKAFTLGEELAKKAKSKKISSVVFDRSFYKYHGRVRAFAEGARKGGLKF